MRRGFLLAGVALLTACGGGDQGPVVGGDLVTLSADKIIVGVRHYITSNGIRQALLLADTAYFYDDGAPIDFRSVELTIYGEAGGIAAILTSETATLDPRTEAMIARGNVVVVAPEDDQRLETDELHYDPGADRLWSDHPTTLIREGRVTRGDGFSSDGRGQNVTVISPSGQVEAPRSMP